MTLHLSFSQRHACPPQAGACAARRHARQWRVVVLCKAAEEGQVTKKEQVENLVVIGSGPAGYTACIYAARANMKPCCFEGYQAGGVRGGQLMWTTDVENFPGFPAGVQGPELMDRMREQAERWGTELLTEDVEHVDLRQRPFVVRGSDTEVRAHSVIIATGATAKRLGLPSETQFWNQGISACAVCDGTNPVFRKQALAVAGGGDSATEEALFLCKYGKEVHLLVRGPQMRASKTMQDRVLAAKQITVHYNTEVVDAFGKKGLEGLHLRDTASGEARDLAVRGLFYGIGHQPNSSLVEGQVDTDQLGYIKVKDGVQTNVEGVFAAGDVHDHLWRQAVTAAGAGCMAALSAERYLSAAGLLTEVHQTGQAPPSPEEEAAAKEQQLAKDKAALEVAFNIDADRHEGQLALRKLYHESKRPLLVLYTSPGCGPCRTLKPIFDKVVDELTGQVHLCFIDIEQEQEIAQAAGVNGTPTLQIFKNKALLHNLPGVKQKKEYRRLIEESLKK